MEIKEIEEIKPKIYKVIELSRIEREKYNKRENRGSHIGDGIIEEFINRPYGGYKSELKDYLSTLNKDELEIICTVMYIGRNNHEKIKEDEFKDLYSYEFNACPDSVDLLIRKIKEKDTVLDGYLLNALDILGI